MHSVTSTLHHNWTLVVTATTIYFSLHKQMSLKILVLLKKTKVEKIIVFWCLKKGTDILQENITSLILPVVSNIKCHLLPHSNITLIFYCCPPRNHNRLKQIRNLFAIGNTDKAISELAITTDPIILKHGSWILKIYTSILQACFISVSGFLP